MIDKPTDGWNRLPSKLSRFLLAFRRRVWRSKLAEALGFAVACCVAAVGLTFVCDRWTDTPLAMRVMLGCGAVAAMVRVPICIYRWVWRCRTPEQLARRIAGRSSAVGDPLWGALELLGSHREQQRSPALCRAAVDQVAAESQAWNLDDVLPPTRHRMAGWSGLVAMALAASVSAIYPTVAWNAVQRCLLPWQRTPRYTFARFQPLSDPLIVPHGEDVKLAVLLAQSGVWTPQAATLQIGRDTTLRANREDRRYPFELPPQVQEVPIKVRVGDAVQQVTLVPTHRPELISVVARVALPEYLQRLETVEKDVRAGTLAVVEGSGVRIEVRANRRLVRASFDNHPQQVDSDTAASGTLTINTPIELSVRWQDAHGLTEQRPFSVKIDPTGDQTPTVRCVGFPTQKSFLDVEQLRFDVFADDDFGVREIGIEWHGVGEDGQPTSVHGEQVLAAGGPATDSLHAWGTFTAQQMHVDSQTIEIRAYARDYHPSGRRAYSRPHLIRILDADQHAVWMVEQFDRWQRQSLEVRDRELQLFEANKELLALTSAELELPEVIRRLERQVEAERSNARSLDGLVAAGENLVREAARNRAIGVGHLDTWAEMLQVLKGIARDRMPSVAELLEQARDRSVGSRDGTPSSDNLSSPTSPGLPSTNLRGRPLQDELPSAAQSMTEAVGAQEEVLAEFSRVAQQTNGVLGNLEGSTFVNRLKSLSRDQTRTTKRIGLLVEQTFGRESGRIAPTEHVDLAVLSHQQQQVSDTLSRIQDDLRAYLERRPLVPFRQVLADMRQQDAVSSIRQLSSDLMREQGLSIAQGEYWADSMDRWAEDLVCPACEGGCPGGKTRDSLPPSIVRDVWQILEGEVNLREDTRVAQQLPWEQQPDAYQERGRTLAGVQLALQARMDDIRDQARSLVDAGQELGEELLKFEQVSAAMQQTAQILATPNVGSAAIAGQTDVIELLLSSRRVNPSGGGASGASPGGGGGGSTSDSALARLGQGTNAGASPISGEVPQATGESGRVLPDEYRAGLDEYFNRLVQPLKNGD